MKAFLAGFATIWFLLIGIGLVVALACLIAGPIARAAETNFMLGLTAAGATVVFIIFMTGLVARVMS